eukprot:snap_masked-scaffold_64-processed-gene-0.74-mRNA-1 protein AED:1.00 eAED:1.00 QI:0/-1/0/0/-1/1/1/0/112
MNNNFTADNKSVRMELSFKSNLVKVENTNLIFGVYIWKKPVNSKDIKADVFDYLNQVDSISEDVPVVVPPYRRLSVNPTTSQQNFYDTVSDEDLLKFKLKAFSENSLFLLGY